MHHSWHHSGRRPRPAVVAALAIGLLWAEALSMALPARAYRSLESTCLIGAPAATPIHWIEGGGSVAACEAACEQLPACGGYSFIRAGCEAPGARCLLIRRDRGMTFNADPCCTSGIRE